MTPIRIMHVVEAFGVGGGVENGIANLIHRMDPDRFDHVLCAVFRVGSQIGRYPADRVRIVCLDQRERKLSTQALPLAQMIRNLNPDIVHSRNWGALETVFAARWTRSCSVIHSEHGVEMNPSAEPWRRRCVRRVAFELAHKVVSVSYQLRDMLARRTGFPSRRIEVIHNGVDVARFQYNPVARRRFRTEIGISEQEFCIGCVGRLSQIKDYPTMLRAVAVLSKYGVPWRLLIAGSGSELPVLEEMVRTIPGLLGRVHFLGQTDRIPDLLHGVDVYALPSICEGISNSLLEALAAGLPAVVSDVGGNPEVIVRDESGLLFPVGDYRCLAELLHRLHRERQLREQLREQALRRVNEQFSLQSMVRKYEEMYTSLAGHRGLRTQALPRTASIGKLS